MNVIKPTNTCFDDALDFFDALDRAGVSSEEMVTKYLVVHGICLMPQSGRPYAHAWVEEPARQLVFQRGLLDGRVIQTEMSAMEFHLRYRPQKVTRYTLMAAARENIRHNHYGPWIEEYQGCVGRTGLRTSLSR